VEGIAADDVLESMRERNLVSVRVRVRVGRSE
jgi:hypothetical protein